MYGVRRCSRFLFFFFFKQKTAYEMRISDWSSDVLFRSDLLIDLMDEGQFVPVEGIRRHAKTECIKDRVICAPGLSPAGTRFLEHCGILNGHVGLLVSGSIAMAHHYRCRSLGGPQVCRPNICE